MAGVVLMLPGVSGSLLAPTFFERVIEQDFGTAGRWTGDLRALHRWWQHVQRTLGPASSVRALADTAALPLLEARGYSAVQLEPHGHGFTGTLAWRGGSRLVLRVAPWGANLDHEWRDVVRAGRTAGARWGIGYNGARLRVVDAQRTWARRGVEFDLALALADERSAVALLALLEAAGADDRGVTQLERLVTRSEAHGLDVCASLSDGVLDALQGLFGEFDARRRGTSRQNAFEQAVTVVYRLLFLLFAEARALVPTWHAVYRDAYSIEALCRRALAEPDRRGTWASVQAISRLAHAGCAAGDLVVTAFNGRLFAPRHAPLAARVRLNDASVAKAIVALATTRTRAGRERVAYADLGVEQLGAVYERLLEYEPAVDRDGPRLSRTSLERKATGSFYTPRAITDFLVRRTLAPLVAGKSAEEILALRVVDPAMGSGAFLVAACRYLSEAAARALVDDGAVGSDDITPAMRAALRRQVVQRCLFGVDLNPMAVQLARLSLWLASLAADRPLTFLDHHLATGDSLLGAWLGDLLRDPASAARRAPGPLPLFGDEPWAAEFAQTVLPARFRLAMDPDDSAATVHAKEDALASLTAPGTPLAQLRAAADLWCASWLATDRRERLTPALFRDLLASLTGQSGQLPPHHRAAHLANAQRAVDQHRCFHWELTFPEVFFDASGRRKASGGFDAVIGNPPWEVLRADTGNAAARDRARADHRARLRFFRDAGVYRHQGSGHSNRYQLFVERAVQLARPDARLGLIVPSGLATDLGSAALRQLLFERTRIERVFGFDNRGGIFPIHRDVRFLVLTATTGGATERVTVRCGVSEARWLDTLPDLASDDPDDARAIRLSPALLRDWDPAGAALPWLRTARDYAILSSLSARVPALSTAAGWQVTFGRELNATDDRAHFLEARAHDALPVIEGKHVEPFQALTERARHFIPAGKAAALVDPRRTFARARIAYRDVASATNRLTLIAARLPAGVISTHTLFCSRDALTDDSQYCLLALLNSLVANYLVRLRVTTHVTTAVMSRLPVPRPREGSAEFEALASAARRLESTGLADEDTYLRLNAAAAAAYGLADDDYAHIVRTFPLLPAELRDRLCAASSLNRAAST